MTEGPRISTDTFELLDGTQENTLEANERFKQVTNELENQLKDRSHFKDFVWPGIGRKSSSPYTSRPNKQSGEYWEACWLSIAHRNYREEFERPQEGLQLQFAIRSYESYPPAGIILHLDNSAPSKIREKLRSNLSDHKETFIDRIESLEGFDVKLENEKWSIDDLESNWGNFLENLDSNFSISNSMTREEVADLGENLASEIVNSFEDLLPLYSLLSGIELDEPPYQPAIWIEKTAVQGRDYKQKGELALGNAIWSPQRNEGGGDTYRLMRHIQPGDIIIHYVKDDNQFEGVSTVKSDLIDDFVCPTDSEWGYEDEDRPGYRYNLKDFVEFDEPVPVDAVLDNERYTDELEQIREDNKHIFYSKRGDGFRPGEGEYLSRVPDRLAGILSSTSDELQSELDDRGYENEIMTGGYWEMVMTKREKANAFLENPSKELFRELVDSNHFWGSMAYKTWHREMFERHSPEEVAETLREAKENGSLELVLSLYQVGEGKATEILRALEPSEYAILNKRSRNGMETLGYELPERNPPDEVYHEFTEKVREAYEEYELRQLVSEQMDESIPSDATELEIADWAFSEDFEDNLDLSEAVDGGWTDAVRSELLRYKTQKRTDTVRLKQIYNFSEERLAKQFPDNDNIKAKIRHILQLLRDNGEVVFLDEEGTYRIAIGEEIGGQKTYEDFEEELNVDYDSLSLEHQGLYFQDWDRIRTRIIRALKEGNNVLLYGPPGTGKTKLARKVSQGAVGMDGFELVTGSADWSTFETIGGYQTTKDASLQFEPGVVLERFHRDEEGRPNNEWLVIDELNRADIDKAFGSLFSALSGESVTLPYEHDNGDNIEILDSDQIDREYAPNQYFIPEDWRMIATMNTLDKTSLYEMSYAFMRRWAFIPIGVPDLPNPEKEGGREKLADLIEEYVAVWFDGSEPEIERDHLATLGEIWYVVNERQSIGPAIVEDIYNYVEGTPEGLDPDFASPVVMYVFPQLEGLRRGDLKEVINGLTEIVGDPKDLRRTAEDFFQTDLSEESEL